MKKTKWQIFINGVFKENPVLILLLGCCSVLAISVTVKGALGMGVALTFVLVGSNIVISLLRKVIPDKVEEPEEVIVPEGLEPEIDPTMPTEMIDGYAYIGTLKIPALGLNLPVMAECDYTRLKISPCVFSGSYKTNDLVICAHNYARHFSPVKWIDLGADVYLTTVDGVMYSYKVSNIETVQPTAVDQMIKNSNNDKNVSNDWDMTLFTCNTGGQTRCAVRCTRMDK